jgi:glyoxalase family protein
MPATPGIHHVSAIAGDPQANVDFYTRVLGLRLVKRTVNFDAPETYHLYYGDESGAPGTLVTFFPWTNVLFRGTASARRGPGQVVATTLAVPVGGLSSWADLCAERALDFDLTSRLGEDVLVVQDADGIVVELLEQPWAGIAGGEGAPIAGVAGATISLTGFERTAAVLTDVLGFRLSAEEGNRYRFTASPVAGGWLDIVCEPDASAGTGGVGSVHHIAFRALDDAAQLEWRELLVGQGYDVSPVMDRHYFRSIYFREPGGVLFEIATDGPGFTVDESPEALGTELRLPPWLEARRDRIVAKLPVLRTP